MTREFRKRMLKQAAFVFVALFATLLILVGSVPHRVFLIAAAVLIPAAAITFNVIQRRAYAAYRAKHGIR